MTYVNKSMSLRNLFSRDRNAERADPDVILVGPDAERKRRAGAWWGVAFVAFMRALATLWISFGVLLWMQILNPGPGGLEALPFSHAVALSIFAVANLVAAVGLWLIAPWGGALWLATVVGEIATTVILGPVTGLAGAGLASYAACIALYFGLTWLSARERERP